MHCIIAGLYSEVHHHVTKLYKSNLIRLQKPRYYRLLPSSGSVTACSSWPIKRNHTTPCWTLWVTVTQFSVLLYPNMAIHGESILKYQETGLFQPHHNVMDPSSYKIVDWKPWCCDCIHLFRRKIEVLKAKGTPTVVYSPSAGGMGRERPSETLPVPVGWE